jgi:hypothetical protein
MMRTRTLAVPPPSNHSSCTRGMSRGGGVVTSDCIRRSKLFGRVAVTHVQGSPKGGGALGMLGVTNARLSPVPPSIWESTAVRDRRINIHIPRLGGSARQPSFVAGGLNR